MRENKEISTVSELGAIVNPNITQLKRYIKASSTSKISNIKLVTLLELYAQYQQDQKKKKGLPIHGLTAKQVLYDWGLIDVEEVWADLNQTAKREITGYAYTKEVYIEGATMVIGFNPPLELKKVGLTETVT